MMAEGMDVLKTAGIGLEPIPKVDPKRLLWLLRLPGWMNVLILKAMIKPYRDIQSSTWQSRVRGSRTEIDYLNGEIVRLAEERGVAAPLNKRVVELVHQAEGWNASRVLSARQLRAELGL